MRSPLRRPLVALAFIVLLALARVQASITISAAPGQSIVIIGGPQRPTATDEGRQLPASLKKYDFPLSMNDWSASTLSCWVFVGAVDMLAHRWTVPTAL